MIFIGAQNGCLYAVDAGTGTLVWSKYFHATIANPPSCGGNSQKGIVSSVAVSDEGPHGLFPVLYHYSSDGYLFKLSAQDGHVIWQSKVSNWPFVTNQNAFFAWSSPTVVNGKVIVGVSSNCDDPFIQGEVRAFSSQDGSLLWRTPLLPDQQQQPTGSHGTCPPSYANVHCPQWITTPSNANNNGCVGAGDWYDAAVNGAGAVFVATASTCDWGTPTKGGPPDPAQEQKEIACNVNTSNTNEGYDEYSLLKLDGDTGAEVWKAPAPRCDSDPDYASSPILFSAGGIALVGATNKDGWFRVYRQDTGRPVWQALIGLNLPPGQATQPGQASPLSGGVWDGTHLVVMGNDTKVGGTWKSTMSGMKSCVPGNGCTTTLVPTWRPSGGTAVKGSIRMLNPASGGPVYVAGKRFELGLPMNPLGPCSMNANRLLICATSDGNPLATRSSNGLFVVDISQAPTVLRHLTDSPNVGEFAQPVQEDGEVVAATTQALVLWKTQ